MKKVGFCDTAWVINEEGEYTLCFDYPGKREKGDKLFDILGINSLPIDKRQLPKGCEPKETDEFPTEVKFGILIEGDTK